MHGNIEDSKRRCLVALAMVASVSMSVFADTVTRLVVWATDGTKAAYDLTEKPKVTFTDDMMTIATGNDADIQVPMSSLSHVTYEFANTVTGVVAPVEDAADISVADNNLVFKLGEGDNSLEIIDLQGRVVVAKILRGDGERIFPLADLQPGVYVVKFNSLTYKIVKR